MSMTLVQSTAMAVLLSVFLTACGGGGGGGSTTTKGSHTKDTDGDGVIDSLDAFPNDKDETKDSDGDGVGDNADAFPNDRTRFRVENDAHSYKPKFDAGFSYIVNLNDDANTKTEKVENIARLVNEAYDNTVQKIIAGIADKSGDSPYSTLGEAVATWSSLSKNKFYYTDHKGVKYSFSLVEYNNESSFSVMISSNDKFTVPNSEFFKNEILESNTDDSVDRKLKRFSYHSDKPRAVTVIIKVNYGTVSMIWSSNHIATRKNLAGIQALMNISESTANYSISNTSSNGIPEIPLGYIEFNKNSAELEFKDDLLDASVKAHYNQNKDILEWIK